MKRYLVFLCGLMFLLGIATTASPIDLPKTGQTVSYAPGDDGEIEAGVAWPSPRFTDNADGTVTDNLTGLMWAQDANLDGPKSWADAVTYVNGLVLGGYDDWRLPNVNELKSLIHAEEIIPAAWLNLQGFTNVLMDYYWSSTTYAVNTSNAWVVDMWDGRVQAPPKANPNYVWPVRAATTQPAELPKTGQTVSYAAGDDGDIQAGVAWPSPRFTDNADGTVTDNLTGLMWAQDANLDGPKSWADALTYVNGLILGGYDDWRLPNVNELESLINAQESSSAAWLISEGFANVQEDYYWSSTTYAVDTSNAWLVYMVGGLVLAAPKDTSFLYVWPVREKSGEAPTPPRDGGDGGLCFIATAAYGSAASDEVIVFRHFRDDYLLTNELGRAFVAAYYAYSPSLAGCIAQHPMLKGIVRIGLYPILGLSKWLVGEDGTEQPSKRIE